jgi:hypothetical protein
VDLAAALRAPWRIVGAYDAQPSALVLYRGCAAVGRVDES